MKTPDSKSRKALAIVTYMILIIWLIYSQNRVPASPPVVINQTVATP